MQLYDSFSGQIGELKSLQPGHLGLYVCGLTTYDHCHIGHVRTFLTFDVLVRHLRASGMQVRYVRNITDVDDRIIERACRDSVSAADLTVRMTDSMHRDFAALGLLPPDVEPRATDSVADMLTLIGQLIENGLAYATDEGNVWFRVSAFAEYGRLSGRTEDREEAPSRQRKQTAGDKEHIRDFALWKAADDNDRQTGSVWNSPWGPGRPGWHIECSAMSTSHLGPEFDLHGGGLDLLFPHHENELAQSHGAGCAFARHWMHVAPLRMGQDKMSKSLGNVLGIVQALRRWPAEALRHALLSAHYRSPLDFKEGRVDESRGILDKWYGALESVSADVKPQTLASSHSADFVAALQADLNTPAALRALSGLVHEINRAGGRPALAAGLAGELVALAGQLGLLQMAPDVWFRPDDAASDPTISEQAIEEQIESRRKARQEGDYAEADRIRQQLADSDVELLDSPQGTSWRRLRKD